MDSPQDRESLRDLDGVRVAVEELTQAAIARGLSRDQLQTSVESKLRRAGIKVLNSGEFPTGDPFLRVRVATTTGRNDLVGYNIEVDFVQIVFMRRNPAVTFNRAQTWKATGQIGLVPPARLAESIRRELSDQVDQFIAAYFSVNPK